MRVLVISDIHANLVALETVLKNAENQYDIVWCLGDIVGYGPRPNECVEIVREIATLCVLGNHDCAVIDNEIVRVDDFNPHARQAVLWTKEQLTAANLDYLDQLPDRPVVGSDRGDFLITHASPREPVLEYIHSPGIAMENFAYFVQPICLFGHTHQPVVYRWRLSNRSVDGATNGYASATVEHLVPRENTLLPLETSASQRLIINPGSVGQPRDSDARAAYAILDLEKRIWQYMRIPYPIELTQGQMRDVGLPRRLIDRISHGY